MWDGLANDGNDDEVDMLQGCEGWDVLTGSGSGNGFCIPMT